MFLVHGHRGARARRPENTVAGFRYAIEEGVDAIELDVLITKELVPLVSHDPPTDESQVPTLDQIFDLGLGSAVRFDVELKVYADRPQLISDPEICATRILALVRRYEIEKRVTLLCFDPRPLQVMKKLDPSIRRAALFETERDWPEVAREFEATRLSPLYTLVTKKAVAWAHSAALPVIPWTVNDPGDWAKLAADGVDGIITDDPASLIAWSKEKGPG